ncbi:MAG: hypothetical protein ABWW70_03705 [Thermoproteota archaeon]
MSSCANVEGVYTYNPDTEMWEKRPPKGRLRVYVLVNVMCIEKCRGFLEDLTELLKEPSRRGHASLSIVMCTRFSKICRDTQAKELFRKFGIIASPSLVAELDGKVLAKLQGTARIEEGFEEFVRTLSEALKRVASPA